MQKQKTPEENKILKSFHNKNVIDTTDSLDECKENAFADTISIFNNVDLVISTGKQTTVKNFVNKVSKKLNMKIFWRGKGISEKAIDQNGKTIIACDKSYYRPLEVNNLLGDSRKAKKLLNWKPNTRLDDLISEMVSLEMNRFDYK